MAKRPAEPDESIEPVIDGLAQLEYMDAISDSEVNDLPEIDLPDSLDAGVDETPGHPVVLIFGHGKEAEALARLAAGCGFEIAIAVLKAAGDHGAIVDSGKIIELDSLDNIVEDCNIERNVFVCIFTEDAGDCELILSQCLASDAWYIGLAGSAEKIAGVFEELREDGAPDAEIAAIAAPMGLSVGAEDAEQHAVAIVAEMLAARSGKLKRLRQGARKSLLEGRRS